MGHMEICQVVSLSWWPFLPLYIDYFVKMNYTDENYQKQNLTSYDKIRLLLTSLMQNILRHFAEFRRPVQNEFASTNLELGFVLAVAAFAIPTF